MDIMTAAHPAQKSPAPNNYEPQRASVRQHYGVVDFFSRTTEDAHSKPMLAASIKKNSLIFRAMAKTSTAKGNPQNQDSALNPAPHLACRPEDATRGQSDGSKHGTALR